MSWTGPDTTFVAQRLAELNANAHQAPPEPERDRVGELEAVVKRLQARIDVVEAALKNSVPIHLHNREVR